MINAVKRVALVIVSCGIRHHFPFAKLLGSLLFIPLHFLIRFSYSFFPTATMIAGATFFLLSLIALYLVLTEPSDHHPVLVLDKVFGLLLTFTAIPLTLKLGAVGFCAFHALRIVMPFVSKRLLNFDFYCLGNVLSFLLPSLLSGALVNMSLRLALWATK